MRARLAATALVCLTLTALVPTPAAAAPATGWTDPWQLESAAITVSGLSVQPLPNGGALAMWVATPGTSSFLAYSTFSPLSGWSQPSYIRLSGSPFSLSLSVNSAGAGVATWIDWTTGGYAFASFFSVGGGFAPPSPVYETQGNNQWAAAVALDDSGMATLLFSEYNGSAYNAFFLRGSAATGVWGPPAPLPLANASQANEHAMVVRVNATGAVFALWEQSNATGTFLFGSTYSGSWSPQALVGNNPTGVYSEVSLEVLADGRAAAAWAEINATGVFTPVVTTFSPGAGWRASPTPLPVATDVGSPTVDLACSDSGRCAAAWVDYSGSQAYVALAMSGDAGAAFQPAVHVDPSLLGNARDADVSLTPQGDGIVAWTQSRTPPNGMPYASTFAAQIDAAGALGPTQRLDRVDSQIGAGVCTAATTNGTTFVCWVDSGAMKQSGLAAVFRPADTVAPKLRVTAPLAGAVINGTSTVVQGVADPGSSVSVNGALALVRADGSFAIRIPLPPGANIIRVSAWDTWNNNVTVLVDVTVFDPSLDIQAQLDAANVSIVYLTENIATVEENNTELRTEFAILIQHVSDMETSWNVTREEFLASQNNSSSQVTRAETNATLAHEATHVVQQRLDGTQSELNTTKAELSSAQTSISTAQSAASSAMTVGMLGVLAGIGGVLLAAMAIRRGGQMGAPKKSFAQRGGVGQGGGLYNEIAIKEQGVKSADAPRQTPKTDFGDRMKAGLDQAGGSLGQAGRGPRQTTSQDGSFNKAVDDQRVGQDPGGIDVSAESESEEEEEEEEDEERSASKDHATGLATGKKGGEGQGGGLYNPPAVARGPRQSTSVDGSFAKPNEAADAKFGAVSGAHRHDEYSKATGRSAAPPRDSATGQASGKRTYDPGKEYLPGDAAVFNDQVVKRDSATGQASGKRESAAPRDAASGQATGKRQATGDLDGDGSADRAVQSPRDRPSGQATGQRSSMAGESLRDAATGQASGKQAEAPMGTHHDVKAPRDAASGQASGKSAEGGGGTGGHGGGGGGGAGGTEASTAKEQLKKNPRN